MSEPGTKYRYSNIGYGLLGVIIEQVSSNGYEEYISQHILAPAGLDKTGYRLVERDEDRIAVNYGRDPNLIEKIFGLTADSESVGHSLQHRFDKPGQRWNLEGSGGFLSTVEDMYKWYMVLRSKGILSEDSWDKIMQPYIPETEEGLSHYGYGWVVDKGPLGNERIWHDGSNGYCFAVFHYYPKLDVLIFYATNNKDDHPQQFMKKLDEIIISNLK